MKCLENIEKYEEILLFNLVIILAIIAFKRINLLIKLNWLLICEFSRSFVGRPLGPKSNTHKQFLRTEKYRKFIYNFRKVNNYQHICLNMSLSQKLLKQTRYT